MTLAVKINVAQNCQKIGSERVNVSSACILGIKHLVDIEDQQMQNVTGLLEK